MTGFRLSRLLRLRKEDEKIARSTWVETLRLERAASARMTEAKGAHDTGMRALAALQGETDHQRNGAFIGCLLYTSPSPRDRQKSRMPSSA